MNISRRGLMPWFTMLFLHHLFGASLFYNATMLGMATSNNTKIFSPMNRTFDNQSTIVYDNTKFNEAPTQKSRDLTFEGTSNFLTLLRQAHKQKMLNPLPHCLHQYNNSTTLRMKNVEIRRYHRAIEVDFVGLDRVVSVEPTWSSSETSSCQFTALAFPPTNDTLYAAIQQTTYVSAFHTAGQCKKFQWGPGKVS